VIKGVVDQAKRLIRTGLAICCPVVVSGTGKRIVWYAVSRRQLVFTSSSWAVPDQIAFRPHQTATKNLNDEGIWRSRSEFETAAAEIIIREVTPRLPGSRILPKARPRGIAKVYRQEY
jgi:hypothetical protein